MRKVLIVDDESSIRFVLARTCERAGVPSEEAGSAEEARDKLRALGTGPHGIGLLLLDVRLPGDDGLKLLGEITGQPHLALRGGDDGRGHHAHRRRGDEARRRRLPREALRPGPGGADRPRPLGGPRARTARPSRARPPRSAATASAEPRRYRDVALPETLVGRSPAMIEVFKEVGRVARTEMTVLLMGESGTGKELVARAVHSNSARSGGPFITVNMAALPRDLIESELYGHEKGSFTGAVERRPGKFELASGGTLFLDEIGEMPIELQAKLLRVLQEREIDRVGGSRALPVDVRVVAATNADLARSVEEGRFRRDLYYRLAVVPIRLPPLREREADVVLLARHFLTRYGQQLKGRPVTLGKDAEAMLLAHPWPGNVRELQNVIQRALLKLNGPRLGAAELSGLLPAAAAAERGLSGLVSTMLDGAEPEGGRYQAALEALEKPLIAAAIARTKGNQLRAAELLGMNRNTLRERMRALGMKAR